MIWQEFSSKSKKLFVVETHHNNRINHDYDFITSPRVSHNFFATKTSTWEAKLKHSSHFSRKEVRRPCMISQHQDSIEQKQTAESYKTALSGASKKLFSSSKQSNKFHEQALAMSKSKAINFVCFFPLKMSFWHCFCHFVKVQVFLSLECFWGNFPPKKECFKVVKHNAKVINFN